MRQGTRNDAWMTDCFRHTNPQTRATHVRVMKSDLQCDVLTHCAHLYMLYEWVFCSHTPSVIGKFTSRQPKLVLNSENIHELSDLEECQEFRLLVVQLLGSSFVDEDECDRFPCDPEL